MPGVKDLPPCYATDITALFVNGDANIVAMFYDTYVAFRVAWPFISLSSIAMTLIIRL